ncbi:hypothetical protein ABNE08_21175 [Paenibacillus larvae]
MKIKKVMIGNQDDAFIEDRFIKTINIISSDDNNKGKTIVIQSMMYALGNEPIFPSSFNFKDYFHIVEIEINSHITSICRKGNSFAVLHKNNLSVFDNLSEFKFFTNRTLFTLPVILKDGFKKIVDPVLFFQIFFVGQDNRDSSNIFHRGYYNKEDFINMLYSFYGIENFDLSNINEKEARKQIKVLQNEKKELEKNNKIINSTLSAIGIVSKANDRHRFEEKLKKVDKLKNEIIILNIKRNRVSSRKTKNEIALKELRSLNKTLTAGELNCLDCGSINIGYSLADDNSFSFDISSVNIRNQILTSIESKIEAYSEEISYISREINKLQDELQSLLATEEVSIESLLMYKPDLVNASEADNKIIEIDNQIKQLTEALNHTLTSNKSKQEEKSKLYKNIIEEMIYFYKQIDPHGNLTFQELFSKKQLTFSGSEETEFYLSKLYALLSVLKHKFPIIIDYFRGGELSSSKEKRVLELFNKFENQVIFTATLKEEEEGKYNNVKKINHINYTPHTASKLLSSKFVEEFMKELKKFSINM